MNPGARRRSLNTGRHRGLVFDQPPTRIVEPYSRNSDAVNDLEYDLRIGEIERDEVIHILQDAYIDGEMVTTEFVSLIDNVFSAKTDKQLRRLLNSLPPVRSPSSETVDSPTATSVRYSVPLSSSGSARRLVTVAASLLPAADRARFCEEYKNELWELTSAGSTRRQQLGYAIRQLLRAVPLRAAVLSPRRKVGL